MNTKYWLLISIFVNLLLFLICVFFVYKWIDASISIGYLDIERHEANEAYRQAHSVMLAEVTGKSKEEFIKSLKKISDDNYDTKYFIFEKNESGYDNVFFGRLVFKFKDDKLVSVERE